MLVIVPTRNRPENVLRQMRAVNNTAQLHRTEMLYCVDADDPKRSEYEALFSNPQCDTKRHELIINKNRGPISRIINDVSRANATAVAAIGFMGDDHLPLTPGWDIIFNTACSTRICIAYGNDCIQGPNLPTHVVMSSKIISTLGHMVPPTLHHLYLDNYWKDLGNTLGILTYFDHVIIQHLHPVGGTAEWDEGYRRVNAGSMYEHDKNAYDEYTTMKMQFDVYRIRQMIDGVL